MLDVASTNWRPAAQQMPRASGIAVADRHHVLQLVAETVSAARLIEAGPRPDAAGERLVEQPADYHDVERSVGSLDLDIADDRFPEALHLRQDFV